MIGLIGGIIIIVGVIACFSSNYVLGFILFLVGFGMALVMGFYSNAATFQRFLEDKNVYSKDEKPKQKRRSNW